ncbi:tetratricopeptide repeat protein [Microbacterium sp. DT81.1]|uniref:tetratricopeptide repeat protein n=1 Tax=Microbacterium sp. DT81.1 TaxID=3393413 RepID=UPI003CEAD338
MRQSLLGLERILGPDHPQTIECRNNLAWAYESAGDLTRAIPLYERAVADFERVMGPDHPRTAGCRVNLVRVYVSSGDLARAVPQLKRVVSHLERVLGSDHPDTLMTRDVLATTQQWAVGSAAGPTLDEIADSA